MQRPIVTITACGILLAGVAAAPAALAEPPAPAPAPAPATLEDASQLAFGRSVDGESPAGTYTIHADGTQLREINPEGGSGRWSPDGGRLVINPCDDPPDLTWCPMILNPSGRVLRHLSVPTEFQQAITFWRPSVWSPDGSRLAGAADSVDPSLTGAYTVNATDGLGLHRLTANPNGADIPGAYSPDGARIELVRGFSSDEGADGAVFVVNLDGSGLTRLTPDNLPVGVDRGSDWSPDGTRIAFSAVPAPGRRFALFTVAPNGTGLRQLPLPCGSVGTDPNGHGCFEPAYSPDGTRLAYTARDAATGFTHIWIANSDGTDAHPLTGGATFDGQADWRP